VVYALTAVWRAVHQDSPLQTVRTTAAGALPTLVPLLTTSDSLHCVVNAREPLCPTRGKMYCNICFSFLFLLFLITNVIKSV
jgi:hypothetical protein